MREWGFAEGYKYAHDYEGGYVEMSCLPEGLDGSRFYEPSAIGHEVKIAARMKERGQLE
jgi:putative ATPase